MAAQKRRRLCRYQTFPGPARLSYTRLTSGSSHVRAQGFVTERLSLRRTHVAPHMREKFKIKDRNATMHHERLSGKQSSLPLCVDLDGTLVRTDTLHEAALSIGFPGLAVAVMKQLLHPNRAALKREIARRAEIDPELLPYNSELVDFLTEAKQAGRTIVLVTAADEYIANAVAEHLGLFDDVIASDGTRNLKGPEKARELVRRYGSKGFDYAANSRTDLAVWAEADKAILVDAPRSVARQLISVGKVSAQFQTQSSRLLAAGLAMRPHQWVKNSLVFVPLLTSHDLASWNSFSGALLVFVALCAAASAVYLVNDMLDLKSDRKHPRKRRRPFASGSLPILHGLMLAVVLLVLAFTVANFANSVALVAAYAATSMGYSAYFKRYPLLDVFVLASLYTLRIVAGGVASGNPVTLWLLAFSGFAFLSLALVKRCAELAAPGARDGGEKLAGRGYYPADRSLLVMLGVGSTFASSVVLALFVGSTAATERYRAPELLWALVPLMLFWQCRLWLATERGQMHDDPITFSCRDWMSWLVAGATVAIVLAAV